MAGLGKLTDYDRQRRYPNGFGRAHHHGRHITVAEKGRRRLQKQRAAKHQAQRLARGKRRKARLGGT